MITVVTGPPCSGKTTYVRSHAKPGDIVIDFDTMAQAFGSPATHNHSAAVRHITIQARRSAIHAAITVHEQTPVWIVDCNISTERLALYKRAGAQIVGLGADKAELHKRAAVERPPLWHKLIDEWVPVVDTTFVDASSRDW